MVPHAFDNTCLGCRAARRLGLTDSDQVQALHTLCLLQLQRREHVRATRERGFDVGAAHITSTIEDEMAEMFAVRPPSTNAIN